MLSTSPAPGHARSAGFTAACCMCCCSHCSCYHAVGTQVKPKPQVQAGVHLSNTRTATHQDCTHAFVYAPPVVKGPACAVCAFMVRALNALGTLLHMGDYTLPHHIGQLSAAFVTEGHGRGHGLPHVCMWHATSTSSSVATPSLSHLVCVPLLEALNFAVLLQLQGENSKCGAERQTKVFSCCCTSQHLQQICCAVRPTCGLGSSSVYSTLQSHKTRC